MPLARRSQPIGLRGRRAAISAPAVRKARVDGTNISWRANSGMLSAVSGYDRDKKVSTRLASASRRPRVHAPPASRAPARRSSVVVARWSGVMLGLPCPDVCPTCPEPPPRGLAASAGSLGGRAVLGPAIPFARAERDVGRPHRLVGHPQQPAAERLQLGVLAQRRAVGGQNARRVVLAPEEAPVDERLDSAAQGLEEGSHRQRR